MGTNCASLLANLFLYLYEVEFLRSMKKSNKKLTKAFSLTSHYIHGLISINNPRFKQFLKDIYPEELVVSETSEPRNVVLYLDLLIDISIGNLVCSTFDKRDAFDFHIVSTYISQLIRFSRAYHNYNNFSSRHSMLENRLFNLFAARN